MQVAGNSSQKRSSVGSTVIDPWTDSMNSEPTSGSEKKRPHVKTQVTQQQQQQQQAEQQRQYLSQPPFHRHKIQAVQFARAL